MPINLIEWTIENNKNNLYQAIVENPSVSKSTLNILEEKCQEESIIKAIHLHSNWQEKDKNLYFEFLQQNLLNLDVHTYKWYQLRKIFL